MHATLALRLAAAALASALALAAHAASITVAVTGADGQPAPDVVVQLLTARPLAWAPRAPVVIAQRDIHFQPAVTAVPVGPTVRFTNEDPFDHHLRSQPAGPLGAIAPAKEFALRLPAVNADKASSSDVLFDKPGLVVLGCHFHSSMRGHLFVSETPLVAVTDATGHATIADVPEGQVELRTWHPEQLVDQPATPHQVAGNASLASVLNFTPPKPRARRG